MNQSMQNPSLPAGVNQDFTDSSAATGERLAACRHFVEAPARDLVLAAGVDAQIANGVAAAALAAFTVAFTSAVAIVGTSADFGRYSGQPATNLARFVVTATQFAFDAFTKAGRVDAPAHEAATRAATIAVENCGAPPAERLAVVAAAVAGAAAAMKALVLPGVTAPKKESR